MYALNLFLVASASASAVLAVPNAWYQAEDSPNAALFKRAPPSPDSADWATNYPAGSAIADPARLPQSWKDKLASLNIPDIKPSNPNNGYPTYANGEQPNDDTICSFTYECVDDEDLHNPPDGVFALSFDDGPAPSSPPLLDFLEQNNASSKATHFMIGSNILYNPKDMQDTFNRGGHIAVHTWSHNYMTTLTNEQVLGELGWTIQIIADLTGGRLPAYWRPPYGDVDNRVRAIAKGVFGVHTVVWNQDTSDWAIGSNPKYTSETVNAQMTQWLTGPKSPGLMVLEHERSAESVKVFTDNYAAMVSNGWNVLNIADAMGLPWYVNAANNQAAVTELASGSGNVTEPLASASASASSASGSASASSASASSSGSASSASGARSSTSSGASASRAAASSSATPSGAAIKITGAASAGVVGIIAGVLSWAL